MVRAGYVVVLAAALAGCPRGRAVDVQTRLAPWLERVDRAWQARGEQGFEPVYQALDEVPDDLEAHPEVRWRRVRLLTGVALAEPEDPARRRGFARARGEGMACLEAEPAVLRWIRAGEPEEAARAVPLSRMGCLAWTGVAWTRWLTTLEGAAATVDLRGVDAMLKRAGQDVSRQDEAPVAWASALLEHVRPEWLGGDRARADAELLAVTAGASEPWVAWADLVRWLPEPPEGRRPTRPPRTPEEVAAKHRVETGELVSTEPAAADVPPP